MDRCNYCYEHHKPFEVCDKYIESLRRIEMKPKEFWIRPIKGCDCEWTNLYPDDTWGHKYHVIETSVADRMADSLERFYKYEFGSGNLHAEIEQFQADAKQAVGNYGGKK